MELWVRNTTKIRFTGINTMLAAWLTVSVLLPTAVLASVAIVSFAVIREAFAVLRRPVAADRPVVAPPHNKLREVFSSAC